MIMKLLDKKYFFDLESTMENENIQLRRMMKQGLRNPILVRNLILIRNPILVMGTCEESDTDKESDSSDGHMPIPGIGEEGGSGK